MKILFSIQGYERGGVATSFKMLAQCLEANGHNVRVILSGFLGKRDDLVDIPRRYILGWTPELGVRIPHLGSLWIVLNCLLGWRLYFRRLRIDWDYDVFVMFHGQEMIWRWYRDRPSLMWLHEMYSARTGVWDSFKGVTRRIYHWSKWKAATGFTKYVAVTTPSAESFKKYYGMRSEPIVINNLIDVKRIDAMAHEERIIPSANLSSKTIIYVGRLTAEKGVDRLINAISKIEDGNMVRLLIVGDGVDRTKLECQVKEQSLSDKVFFCGEQTNPYPYMRMADLLVLPSRDEGMGIVLWEALLCGTPVLATDCGGVRDTLNNGRWGTIVENSIDGLVRGLNDLLRKDNSFDMKTIREEIIKRDADNRRNVLQIFEELKVK